MDSDSLWLEAKEKLNLDQEYKYSGDLGFESQGFAGTARIAALLAGKKRAAFSSYAAYEADNEIFPVSGEYYIVKNAEDEAVCVIRVSGVEVLPFNAVPWQMAQLEGEDGSLEEWRERTREILEEEGEIIGYDFAEDMKLVFMAFDVVYKRG